MIAPVAGRPPSAAPSIGVTAPRRRPTQEPRQGVPPLMAVAVVVLIGGLWEGLVYLGLPLADRRGRAVLPGSVARPLRHRAAHPARHRDHALHGHRGLLTGYVWLAAGGVLWLDIGRLSFTDLGPAAHGSAYDAVFLGFVISMIFAHAPVIVPAVLGRPLPFTRSFYLPLAMLHVTLMLRLVGGDALHNEASWQWGGSLNEVALLLFVGLAAAAVLRAGRSQRTARQAQRPAGGGVSAGSTMSTRTGETARKRPSRPAGPAGAGARPGKHRAAVPGYRHRLRDRRRFRGGSHCTRTR